MRVFTKFYTSEEFTNIAGDLNDLNWSLFIDEGPQSNDDLSELNVFVTLEPNEYFGIHDWVIKNKNIFSPLKVQLF